MLLCFVLITDVETPVISGCPSDITVSVKATESTSNVSWTEPTAADNSNNVGLTTSHSPNSIFSIGNTNVTYTATDGSGNSDTCLFVVTVLGESILMVIDIVVPESKASMFTYPIQIL